jgi:hypothetical protein
MIINRRIFYQATGRFPQQGDIENCNCKHAGEPGHYHCGWCLDHHKPAFECGCIQSATQPNADGIE